MSACFDIYCHNETTSREVRNTDLRLMHGGPLC